VFSIEFKKWMKLQEVGTSTGDVAVFQRIAIPLVRRQVLGPWGEEDPFFKKKRKDDSTSLKRRD
jgi:hypothetical protein